MKHKEKTFIFIAIIGITVLFFYKTFFLGLVPFPGDILVSDFQPWRSTSYLGYGAGGIPNKAQYPDTIRQIYPWKTLVVDSLKKGRLPLWNPYNFSGAPLLANFQSAALYPLGAMYLLFSQIDAWTILVMLQPLLAVLFTYIYSRKIGLGIPGSWLAALSYGFSGFMAVWLEYNTIGHVILWLPLMLLAIEHNAKKPAVLWLGIMALAHAASLLAGHPQVYAYTLAFSILYSIARAATPMWKYIWGFTAFGIGICGLQLLPGIELISHAARSPHDLNNLFTKILIQPWQLLSLPFPNFFGNPATRTYWPADTFIGKVTTIGLIPLFFLPSVFRIKMRITTWFIWATVITGLLITNNPVTQIIYRIPIPLLSSSSPTLLTFLFSFSLAVLCGMGLDYWITDWHSIKKLFARTLEVAILFGVLWLFHHTAVATRAIIYGSIVSTATLTLFWIAIKYPKLRMGSIFILLIVHALDLFVFFNRFNPFVPKALVFPDHAILQFLKEKSPDRYWGYGTANIAANFASQYRIFSPEGYDPLYPASYGKFLYSYKNGSPLKTFDNATRSDAAITSSFGDGGLSNTHKQNILNTLSVRYILDRTENGSSEKTYPPGLFNLVHSFEDWRIYENVNALPRAYVDGGTATILTYLPQEVTIQTESTASSILTLTDTYYPGWEASIDGESTTLYKTQNALRSIPIPAGKHIVNFVYRPESVKFGIIVSVISFIGASIALIHIHRKKI